ncbi:MAG TPA: GNAT family N-acetyltransferase [Hyphomicrobiaceae bacterium]|nr:GNAT family N-acetyltransferase [Hyphomicrobiaceae bacterium]
MTASLDEVARRGIVALEERGFAAWPALMTVLDDGWVIRLSRGHTKRANSINVLGPSSEPLAEKCARAEALLAWHGLPIVYRLSPLAPAELTALLDQRRYELIDDTRVMVADLKPSAERPDPRVSVRAGVAPDWTAAYAAADRVSVDRAATLQQMMASIAPPHATAEVVDNGHRVAYGLGVVDRGMIGMFEILVAPSHRRQGLAAAIMAGLLDWGRRNGARRSYLQVVASNSPAIALYERLGYREVYRYHYRVA